MRADLRRDKAWHRQAARGVGWVVALSLAVFAIGAAVIAAFVLVMG